MLRAVRKGQAESISGEIVAASFSPCPSGGRTRGHSDALCREPLPPVCGCICVIGGFVQRRANCRRYVVCGAQLIVLRWEQRQETSGY